MKGPSSGTEISQSPVGSSNLPSVLQGRSVEATPKHLIIVDGAILQPIPEHPKRDFIFCLSTAFGDAYLFQVGNVGNRNSLY